MNIVRAPLLCALVLASSCLDLDPARFLRDAGVDAGTPVVPMKPSQCARTCEVPPPSCRDANTRVTSRLRACDDTTCQFLTILSTCADGCVDGGCTNEPCTGVYCDNAPPPECIASNTLRTFVRPGTCTGGTCGFAVVDYTCPEACDQGACVHAACTGVTCQTPPPSVCVGSTLRVYGTPGVCNTSTGCVYSPHDVVCANGCSNGTCLNDPCAGLTCDQPQPATCATATSRRLFASMGSCSGGACTYPATVEACAAGEICQQGRCVTPPPSCTAANCAGCCDGVTCVLPTAQSAIRCGMGANVCSACPGGQACNSQGACVCVPQCNNRQCGSDGCGGTCGSCTTGLKCNPNGSGQCICDSESDTAFCALLGKTCGMFSANDNCGSARTVDCGACSAGTCTGANVCSACTAESDPTFCSRQGKTCGTFMGFDNCGTSRSVNCGACSGSDTCSNNVCACQPELNAAFCARQGATCGSVTANDNCGTSRSVNCGSCTSPQTCNGSHTCSCTPESDPTFCSRLGKTCGSVSGIDNCGTSRTVTCGSCTMPETCGPSNTCSCTAESNAAFCSRVGATCGSVTAADNCGTSRTVSSCGTCTTPQTCNTSHTCSCMPESDLAFCTRTGKECGSVTANDNCGTSRTVASCGSCSTPETCGGGNVAGVCGVPRMVFMSTYQTLSTSGGTTLEFKCTGTIGTTSSGGTSCTGTDGVKLRINGTEYVMYPGCADNRNNCMDSNVPSTGTYKNDDNDGPSRLLCDAMGWDLTNSEGDQNPGTTSRSTAVLQTGPVIYGTAASLKNYVSYVHCNP